jgi:trk system potassium uptake protein TrkH
MPRLSQIPFLVQLIAISGLGMILPALHGYATGDANAGRPFFYGAITVLFLAALLGLATYARDDRGIRRDALLSVILAYVILPPILALPFHQALPDTRFANAWFEMLSCFTTTGATLYDIPGRLAPTLHLWRALVGWLGGFYILVVAVAVLLPMNLGGMEVLTGRSSEGPRHALMRQLDPFDRLPRFAIQLFPAYAGFTLVLWIGLVMLGEAGFGGLMLAMATISASAILPDGMQGIAGSGLGGEALVGLFMCLGISRRAYRGALFDARELPIMHDPEARMAFAIVGGVALVLALRHWLGAVQMEEGGNLQAFATGLAGALFTALSFLTTNGLVSDHWETARNWSGLESHGLILMGLAIFGGGVATTAGGVKLLRVYALFRLGQREVERLIHPHSVGGGGLLGRRLRGEGAYLAWIFFMLFGLSILAVTGALTLTGLAFDPALVMGIAALTTTGPLAGLAADVPLRFADLGSAPKAVLGLAMILGRVEVLAVLSLLSPDRWRR